MIFDLFWVALTSKPQERSTFFFLPVYFVKRTSLPILAQWVDLLKFSCKTTSRKWPFSARQSSLYAKASQIDRPLNRSHLSGGLAFYFQAFIPPVTVRYVGYIYLAETDKLPGRDFHPLGQTLYWLQSKLDHYKVRSESALSSSLPVLYPGDWWF